MKLTVHTFVSLDGVMQGPGGPDEDRAGGFGLGGWVVPWVTEAEFGSIVDGWFAKADAILFGRTTYDMMAAFWPGVTDPADTVAARLNTLPKYVVSTTLRDPGWQHTTLIDASTTDVVAAVQAIKDQPGGELQVHGSCGLIHTLHDAGLVDEYRLIVFPVVLGTGKRLFEQGAVPRSFEVAGRGTTSFAGTYLELRPTGAPSVGDIEVVDGKESVTTA